MRPSLGEVSVALYGAWRLLRFDPNGINYFQTSRDAFWKSFYAAVICLPGIAISSYLTRQDDTETLPAIVADGAAFFVGLLAMAALVQAICEVIDRQKHFVRCVVAFNWSSIPKVYVSVPVFVLATPGSATGIGLLLLLCISIFILVYEGFVFYRALETTGLTAAGLVAANFAVSLFLQLLITA